MPAREGVRDRSYSLCNLASEVTFHHFYHFLFRETSPWVLCMPKGHARQEAGARGPCQSCPSTGRDENEVFGL